MIKNSVILKIDKKNLIRNYNFFKNLKNNIIVAPTIKANGYGLGDKEIFEILVKNKCKNFFVATLEEGIKISLKNKKINIYVLNGIQNYNLKLFKNYNLTPIINSLEELKIIIKSKLNFGLHIDTGINRLGINFKEIPDYLYKNKKINIIISHLASADEKSNYYNKLQKNRFIKVINNFSKKNIIYSLSNSNGSVLSDSYLFNMIRPGIGLYGGSNKNKLLNKKIKPVVTLRAKVIQVKSINKSEFVGYNQTYKTNKKIQIAIIGIGYADGIKRNLSNKGIVYYKKDKFRIIGRISMDSLTIDITNSQHNLKVGDYIDLINNRYGIEAFANQCNTLSNEIITSIGSRVKRIYV